MLQDSLKGIRILDLSMHLPGALCTQYLSDLGAEVVKIEPPQGDEIRHVGPKSRDGESIYFQTMNAGKAYLTLDLKEPEDHNQFIELVQTADILLESYRPGTMARLNADHASLEKINQRLIYCSINGFGSSSPQQSVAAHDLNFLALGGFLLRNHGSSTTPPVFDPPIIDCTAALTAAIGILSALRAAEQTGQGCHIEAAMADVAMPLQQLHIAEFSETGKPPKNSHSVLNGGAAYYRTYQTSDGKFLALCAVELKFWQNFCHRAGQNDWPARHGEPMPQTKLANDISTLFASMTQKEAVRRFSGADCCLSPVVELDAALKSEHYQSSDLIVTGSDGSLQCLFPMRANGQAVRPRERAASYLDIESIEPTI